MGDGSSNLFLSVGAMMRTALFAIAALLSASSAFAQLPPAVPTSVEIQVLPALGDPLTTPEVAKLETPISAASAMCNRTASVAATTPLVNPTAIEMDDPFNAGKTCRVSLPPLAMIPNGSGYRTTGVYIAATCDVNGAPSTNCRSARAALAIPPFSVLRQGLPAAPTNLAVKQ